MAKKVFCDACGKVTNPHIGRDFSVPIHISQPDIRSYIQVGSNEPSSGRYDNYDLCLTCSNKILTSAYRKLQAIQHQKQSKIININQYERKNKGDEM